jgi:hypothetical protein
MAAAGGNYVVRNFIMCATHCITSIRVINSRKMMRHMVGKIEIEKRNAHWVLAATPEGKRPLGRRRLKW